MSGSLKRDRMKNASIKRQTIRIGLLLIVCLVIFSNTFSNAFIWDDPYLITENPSIRDLSNIPLFFRPYYWNVSHPSPGSQALYRPLRTTSFALDYHFWGLNPAGYHLTNLLLHMANVVLVFFVISAIAKAPSENGLQIADDQGLLMSLPFLTALLFAAHPIHTESVTYIKNRSDLLAALFFWSAFLLFIKYDPAMSKLLRRLITAGSLLCFTLALLSKEMALSLPLVLLLYITCFRDRSEWFRTFGRVVPYGLVAVLSLWFSQTMFTAVAPPKALVRLDLIPHILAVVKTLGTYLWLLAFPVNLNAERAFSVPRYFWEPGIVFSLAVPAGIAIVAGRSRVRTPLVLFGIAYVFITLLPAANIVFLISRPVAEQRLYIPSLGFCLLTAWVLHALYQRKIRFLRPSSTAVLVSAGMIVAAYGIGTYQRNKDWRDPITFYTRTIQSNPGSPRIYNNLGIALAEQGRRDEAIVNYKTALRIDPEYASAYNNLGVELAETNRPDEAVKYYKKALRIKPDYAAAHYNLGTALIRSGNMASAVDHIETALRLAPDNVEALNALGLIYDDAGRFKEAVNAFIRALGIKPDFMTALTNLGATLVRTGDIDDTVRHLLAPALSARQLARVYNSSATILLKSGDRESAVRYYREAVRLDPSYTDGLYNLGLALVLEKQYPAAIRIFDHVLSMHPDEKIARQRRAFCLRMMNGGPD